MNKSCNRLPPPNQILSGIGENQADDDKSSGENHTVNA